MRNPSAAAMARTSLRATAMSWSCSRANVLLSNRAQPPVSLLFVFVPRINLAAKQTETLVHVQDRIHASEFEAEFDERDGDGGLHPDDDRARVHDARHRRNVREHPANK